MFQQNVRNYCPKLLVKTCPKIKRLKFFAGNLVGFEWQGLIIYDCRGEMTDNFPYLLHCLVYTSSFSIFI